MQSRTERYQTSEKKRYERTKKNTKLYEKVYDDIYSDTTYKNMQVIDSAKEININRLKDMIDNNYDTRRYRTLQKYEIDDDFDEKLIPDKNRQKIYDINEIISEAKSKRAFIEEAKEKQKYIDFTASRSKNYDEYEQLEKEEQELEELINTMAISKQNDDTNEALDLFTDLKGGENTIVTNPIASSFDISNNTSNVSKTNYEKTDIKADRTFYTDSNMFTKNDFEDFSTLTSELSRSNKFKKIIIVILVLLILGVLSYYIITNFIMK